MSFGPSLTVDAAGSAVGAFTSATGALVTATVWGGAAWSAPAAIAGSATARDLPWVDAAGGATVHLTYQDSTYHYWYAAFIGGSWTTTEAIPSAASQAFGPVPATIAARGADATLGFIDGRAASVNDAASVDLTSGAWGALTDFTSAESFSVPPVIVALTSSSLLMVFESTSKNPQMQFATRTGSTWSSAAAISGCLTNARPAVAALPSGGAILAFTGTDGFLYWSMLSTSGAWTTAAPFASPNVAVVGSPAITHGVGSDAAELAYATSAGGVFHARLSGTTWSTPVQVATVSGVTGVAIAAR
jgi:hypothetical protein